MIHVPVGPGELIDKITILEIKREHLVDARQLANVQNELTLLEQSRTQFLPPSSELTRLTAALKSVNQTLWQIEDDIRACERAGDFGPKFVALARAVYHRNDERAALKREINQLLRSPVMEEKSYQAY